MVNVSFLINHLNTVILTSTLKTRYTANVKHRAGVYVFFRADDSKVAQCGSNINFTVRLKQHYSDQVRYSDKLFYKDGLAQYYWNPIRLTTNYYLDYVRSTGLIPTNEEILILNSFTQQEVRSLEQAVSTFRKPIYYNNVAIATSHNNWQPGNVTMEKGKSVTWITKDGQNATESSITKASIILGVDRYSLRRVANSPYYIATNRGDVRIIINGLPDIDNIKNLPSAWKSLQPNLAVDFSRLPDNNYYLFDENMQITSVGPFATLREVNETLGYKQTHQKGRYVNTTRPITSLSDLNGCFYLVRRKLNSSKGFPITANNLNNDSNALHFSSNTDRMKFFNIKNYLSSIVFFL